MRIINELIVVVIVYGFDKKEGEKNILVFDLGGGIFDVFFLIIDNGVFEVVVINGDIYFGKLFWYGDCGEWLIFFGNILIKESFERDRIELFIRLINS